MTSLISANIDISKYDYITKISQFISIDALFEVVKE